VTSEKYGRIWLIASGLSLILIGVLFGCRPASATVRWNGHTVCVKENLHGSMDRSLTSALRFVDQFTGSRLRRVSAHTNCSRTLTIRSGTPPQVTAGGRTYAYTNAALTIITIDPRTPSWARTRMLEHELGHAFYLRHSTGCNVMKAIITCHGKLVPAVFTASQRKILARH
jgi:hypothetical protein